LKILKFGGSSVATPERIGAVTGIVADAARAGPCAIVVSALGGVTDALVEAATAAARGTGGGDAMCDRLEERHRLAASAVARRAEAGDLVAELRRIVGELRGLLHGASLVREASPRTADAILAHGERLSAPLVAAALRAAGIEAEPCDARGLIVTDATFGRARVDFDLSDARLRAHFAAKGAVLQVVTGFIAATQDGETTTLGRGGSDYTAAIVGAALGAEAVELWTDVDGVMSADPRRVAAAEVIPELSYEELMELSHFGAKVVHPPTLHPVRRRSIPLVIRNTLRPAAAGTRISAGLVGSGERRTICGISSIPGVALLRLEGDGMVGVPGIAERLFGSLARHGINVILITQASSEHSICFAVAPDAVALARRAVAEEFLLERRAGIVDALVVEDGMSIVAAVGAGMRERPGIAGRLFGVLGDYGVNVRAIAQGSSELNISFVVRAADESRTLNVVHEAFYTPHERRVDLAVAGPGRVGAALLGQIQAQRPALERQYGLRLRVIGLAGRRGAVLDPEGLDCGEALERVRREARGSLDELVAELTRERWPRKVFVDCTASAEAAAHYDRLLRHGVSVVTANKLRLAGPLDDWHALAAARPGRLFYETTVGAGLPVIRTLGDLCATGDRVIRIDGLLSGTLGFLAAELGRGRRFSEAVRAAYDLGYTEPDPREDLSGQDVARKLIILGRLAGMDLEPADVETESLLPRSDGSARSLEAFWERLTELDEPFAERQRRAREAGRRLCYLGTVGEGRAAVRLEAVGPDHPCGQLDGTDNLIAFTTDRYRESPLVVRGPGAGPEVTAAGVLADVLRAMVER
jgi:aspartokinase/homoserine dehydrogenase 1